MELHRSRLNPLFAGIMLAICIVVAWGSQNGWELRILLIPVGSTGLLVVAILAAVGTIAALASGYGPPRVAISEAGLRLRTTDINATVPWADVDAVILEPSPVRRRPKQARLLLVPAATANLGVTPKEPNKVDGRPAILLVSMEDVQESPAQVAQALAWYAGPRFVNGLADPGSVRG